MAIKGSLKEASLPDVIQLLTMGSKSGCLSVADRQRFGYIYFQDGRIIHASLLNRRDRLGDILVRLDVVAREDVDAAIEEQNEKRDGRRLGEILIDQGLIDQQTLERYVWYQVQEAVYHLFTWSQGTFYFEPGKRPELEPILVSIDTESLLLEGARRVDEWQQIEKKVPSLEIIFSLDADRSAALSSLDLTSQQEKILPYLDGKHSGWDLLDKTSLSEFDVGKALYGLVSAGLARRTGRREQSVGRAGPRGRVDEHRNLGIAFYQTAMLDEAVREFKLVQELAPDSLDAEFYQGLIALRRGDLEAAERRFRALLGRDDTRVAVYNNLALVLSRRGSVTEAVALLEKCLERTSGHAKIHLTKAALQLKAGDPSAAKGSLDDYAQKAGENLPPLYYSAYALANAMSADLEAAVRVAEEGVERHPGSAALANNAGVVFERKGDYARAHVCYEQAYEQETALPQASKNVGDLLYRDGRYDEAAEAYERALRANPNLGDDTYAKLGNIYYKRRERGKAVALWERALQLNPSNEIVRTNLEFVKGPSGDR